MNDLDTTTRAGVYRIEDLTTLVDRGRLRVPEFQRNFRWSRKDVLSLFDSILKGYPVGSLLLWSRPAPAAELTIGELRVDAPASTDAMWVVDGQQRITAIANAVSPTAYDASERFRIDFDLSKSEFVPGLNNGDGMRVPLPVLFNLRRLIEWTQARPDATEQISALNTVAVRLRDFAVPASIVSESDPATLREIFDRTNNAGKKLRRAEVFHALFSEQGDDGLTIDAIADGLTETGFGRIDGDTVLHAILARRHADFTRDLRQEFSQERRSQLDVAADETRDEAYQGGRDALRHAIEFLQNRAAVPHITFLPYRYLLTTLARFFAHHPEPHPRNLDLLIRWFWRASLAPTLFAGSATSQGRGFTSRVNPTDESRSVQDLLNLVPDDTNFIFPNPALFRTNTAATKVMLCAMYDARPRRFSDGQVIDITAIAESLGDDQTAHGIVADIVPRTRIVDPPLAGGIGGRFLLLDTDVALEDARAALTRSNPPLMDELDLDAIAESHVVDQEASAALRRGNYDHFLQRRSEAISKRVDDFLETRMELGFPSTQPIRDYDFDEIFIADDQEPGHAE